MSPEQQLEAARNSAVSANDLYHLRELATALDPSHPGHALPKINPGEKVLDIGCGAGQTLIASCAYRQPGQGGLCVTCSRNDCPVWGYGIDVDLGALRLGGTWSRRMVLRQGRAEQLPFTDAEFDVVISRVALPYTDLRAAVREIRRVLKPAGRLWLLLHPFSLILRQAEGLSLKGYLSRLYVAANGLIFHLTLRTVALFGRRESWQSSSAMKRLLLQSGFTDVRIERTDRLFLITARG